MISTWVKPQTETNMHGLQKLKGLSNKASNFVHISKYLNVYRPIGGSWLVHPSLNLPLEGGNTRRYSAPRCNFTERL